MRFLSGALLVAVLPWSAALAQSGAANPHKGSESALLERAEVVKGQDGKLQLVFVCRPAPPSYSLKRSTAPGETLILTLPGYRSRVPADVAVDAGTPVLRLTEDPDGVRAEYPAAGVEVLEVRAGESGLIVVLGQYVDRIMSATAADLGHSPPPAWGRDVSYRVGPGDLLAISVFGQDDLSKSVRVVSNGTINFPLVGDLVAAGLTPAEIGARLTEMLARDYVVNPQVLVGVSEYQSQSVNVIGEVRRPGKYFLKGPTHLIDILSEAGGLADTAGSEVMVVRSEPGGPGGDKKTRQMRISLEDLFGAKDNNDDRNISLVTGDVVHVQQSRFFYIRGEVGRPGQYALRPETTIQKAISLAGGFSQWADEKDVQLIREGSGEKRNLVVNLRKIEKGLAPDIKIEAEDIILVSRRIL